ncbi:hypothetical protein RRG08_004917 [Elysia crispata]|uniref:Uncharacterized protein n=1 Tax=Elysia crispata TaxID=231223 RepID=A0AAE1DH68_9GAST|nr:hypothetical protein RRG08_004917 [Elysia crispata]
MIKLERRTLCILFIFSVLSCGSQGVSGQTTFIHLIKLAKEKKRFRYTTWKYREIILENSLEPSLPLSPVTENKGELMRRGRARNDTGSQTAPSSGNEPDQEQHPQGGRLIKLQQTITPGHKKEKLGDTRHIGLSRGKTLTSPEFFYDFRNSFNTSAWIYGKILGIDIIYHYTFPKKDTLLLMPIIFDILLGVHSPGPGGDLRNVIDSDNPQTRRQLRINPHKRAPRSGEYLASSSLGYTRQPGSLMLEGPTPATCYRPLCILGRAEMKTPLERRMVVSFITL